MIINLFKKFSTVLIIALYLLLIPSGVQADSLSLIQSTNSPSNAASIAPSLDLTSNLYTIALTGATWNPLTAWEFMGIIDGGGNYLGLRTESSKLTFYSVKDYVAYFSQANLLNLVSGTKYNFELDVGSKNIRLFADGVQILKAQPYRINGAGGIVTTQVFDPVNPRLAWVGPHTAIDNISVYQRNKSLMTNLVLLGDSITAASAFESRLSQQLTRDTFISNHGQGYRQSREMRMAIATSSPGDRYNVGTMYYPDVAGFYRSDMASNKILMGIGTNDLIWYNSPSGTGKGTPDGSNTYGPEEGGYVAVDAQDGNDHNTINNILTSIDDIVANNPGWKVYFRTPLNLNGFVGGGIYAAGEAKRQAIRTSALSGLIKQKVEATGGIVIDQDNIFAPAASRTDGVNANGAAYNASYWPQSVQASGYSNNTTYFDSFHIHPTTAGYNVIADYVASKLVDTTPPTISSVATSTTGTTATISWTTNERATSTIRYGLTTAYGATSTSASATTTHSVTLTGLSSEATYHFQISVADSSNNLATSSDLTFTTIDITPPTISSLATSTTQTTATITWTTNEAATSTVDYGLTTSYGTTSSSAIATTSHTFNLSNLNASSLYNFRISSWDPSGNLATSSNQTFTTLTQGGSGCSYVVYTDGNTTYEVRCGVKSIISTNNYSYYDYYKSLQKSLQDPASITSATTTTLFASSTLDIGNSVPQNKPDQTKFAFGNNLNTGPSFSKLGDDIKKLQKYLNNSGFPVATTGPGTSGKETTTFGPATKKALIKFQKTHGIPGTGFFGPITRSYINSH